MGATWITPNEAWTVGGIGVTDLNRIESNIDYIRNQASTFFGVKSFSNTIKMPNSIAVELGTYGLIYGDASKNIVIDTQGTSKIIMRDTWIEINPSGGNILFKSGVDNGLYDLQLTGSAGFTGNLSVDNILEYNAGTGVTIDGLLLKDGGIGEALTVQGNITAGSGTMITNVISELTGNTGITIDSVLLKDGNVIANGGSMFANAIGEVSSGLGVTIDGVLLKDGGITIANGVFINMGSTAIIYGDGAGNAVLDNGAGSSIILRTTGIDFDNAINPTTTTTIGTGVTITSSGALTCTTVNTGLGSFEIGQNLRPSDNAFFAGLIMGGGGGANSGFTAVSWDIGETQGTIYARFASQLGGISVGQVSGIGSSNAPGDSRGVSYYSLTGTTLSLYDHVGTFLESYTSGSATPSVRNGRTLFLASLS